MGTGEGIEIGSLQDEIGGIDAVDGEDGFMVAVRCPAFCDAVAQGGQGEWSILKIAVVEIFGAFGGMDVRVDQAGQHGAPAEIDEAGGAADPALQRRVGAGGGNDVSGNGERLHHVAAGILGVYPAVQEHDVCGRDRAGGAEGG